MKNFIAWNNVRGVIFDIDGTLYDQRKLRIMMMFEIGKSLFQNRQTILDIRVINNFRKNREKLADNEIINISTKQFLDVANDLSIDKSIVSEIINEWIYKRPLKYMEICKYPQVGNFFNTLKTQGIKIGIFSDYPVEEKLFALDLHADAVCYSLEPGLDKLKPQSVGLETIINRLNIDKSECIFIGDRYSRDGECARRLGINFILCTGTYFYKRLLVDFENCIK